MGSITLFELLKDKVKGALRGVDLSRLLGSAPTRSAQLKPTAQAQGHEEGAREVLEALALLSSDPAQRAVSSTQAEGRPLPLEAALELEGLEELGVERATLAEELGVERATLAEELASLIELDQRSEEPTSTASSPLERGRSATVLLSAGAQHLSMRASAWEVLCVTLKLAKVFPKERCQRLAEEGGSLSVLELQQVRQHAEQVLLKSMERGDYLFADLSLSDLAPQEAFKEGDPRREEHLDRAALTQLTSFAQEARSVVMVRRLQWRQLGRGAQVGDPDAIQRARRAQRGG